MVVPNRCLGKICMVFVNITKILATFIVSKVLNQTTMEFVAFSSIFVFVVIVKLIILSITVPTFTPINIECEKQCMAQSHLYPQHIYDFAHDLNLGMTKELLCRLNFQRKGVIE